MFVVFWLGSKKGIRYNPMAYRMAASSLGFFGFETSRRRYKFCWADWSPATYCKICVVDDTYTISWWMHRMRKGLDVPTQLLTWANISFTTGFELSFYDISLFIATFIALFRLRTLGRAHVNDTCYLQYHLQLKSKARCKRPGGTLQQGESSHFTSKLFASLSLNLSTK